MSTLMGAGVAVLVYLALLAIVWLVHTATR